MAPQNSTLLHENIELTTNLPSHCSPIMKPMTNFDTADTSAIAAVVDKCIGKSSKRNAKEEEYSVDEIPIWICGEPRYISGVTSATTCNELIQALIDDELNSDSTDVAASRDLNDYVNVKDYVITEKWRDVEQALTGDTKILPIWIAWGSARHEVKFKLKINKNKAGTKIVDDYNSNNDGDANHHRKQYKQAENLRKIKMAHLIKRLINQGESIKQQLALLRQKQENDRLRSSRPHQRPRLSKNNYLLESFLFDTLESQCRDTGLEAIEKSYEQKLNEITEYTSTSHALWKPSKCETMTVAPDDELFLVIDDNDSSGGERERSVHVEYRQYYLNKKLDLAIATKAAAMAAVATSKKCNNTVANNNRAKVQCIKSRANRKSIPRKLEFDAHRQNSYNKRLIKYLCTNINQPSERCRNAGETANQTKANGRNAIEFEIDERMAEMYELIAREEQLMKTLSTTCERYRNQNDKYMTKLRLEMCIDEVQHNLDVYAKEIIESELELYKIQNEIQKKCGILYNLKRMVGNQPQVDSDDVASDDALRAIANDSNANDDDIENFLFDISNNKSFII